MSAASMRSVFDNMPVKAICNCDARSSLTTSGTFLTVLALMAFLLFLVCLLLGAGFVSGQREGHDGKETSVLEQGREPLRHAFVLCLCGRFWYGAQLIQQAIEREQQPRVAREEIVEARAVVQPHLQARRRRVQHAIA